jgi:hypothetical protein
MSSIYIHECVYILVLRKSGLGRELTMGQRQSCRSHPPKNQKAKPGNPKTRKGGGQTGARIDEGTETESYELSSSANP